MHAPDAIFSSYEIHNPLMQKKAPKSTANSMRFFNFFEKKEAIAAGAVNSAKTKIIPATLMSTTTVIATKISSKYSKKAVLMPII